MFETDGSATSCWSSEMMACLEESGVAGELYWARRQTALIPGLVEFG